MPREMAHLTIAVGATLSSASLPSHKTRWVKEEDELLKEGLVIRDKSGGQNQVKC
ncbi:hypothetical protein BD408DRAFT_410988 [Parasitella parasitica]|nr:hypothetical protein BD408DRAFT_410988 [Parasitella parasitica]